MMTLADAKKQLNSIGIQALEMNGFVKKRDLTFYRKKADVENFIFVGLRKDARGYWAASCSIGLGFRQLDKFLGNDPQEFPIHLNFPIHIALELTAYKEWEFVSADDLGHISDKVKQSLVGATQYLEKNCSLEGLLNNLRAEDPRRWFGLPREKKDVLLAAAFAANGQLEEALTLVDASIEKFKNGPEKRLMPFVALRARLLKP